MLYTIKVTQQYLNSDCNEKCLAKPNESKCFFLFVNIYFYHYLCTFLDLFFTENERKENSFSNNFPISLFKINTHGFR